MRGEEASRVHVRENTNIIIDSQKRTIKGGIKIGIVGGKTRTDHFPDRDQTTADRPHLF